MRWVWEHRDEIGGLSFLPSFDANYAQMPYVEITKEEFEKRAAEFPEIDFSKILALRGEGFDHGGAGACMLLRRVRD